MKQKFSTLLVIALGCVVLFSKSAHAAGPMASASWVALAGGNIADVQTTYANLPAGGGRCVELNSGFYGSSTPSLNRVIVGKLAIMAPLAALSVIVDKKGEHKAANTLRFIAGGMSAGFAGWNLSRHCR